MRVKFGNYIDECSRITHSMGSETLLITNRSSVYTVDTHSVEKAEEIFKQALIDGYIDISMYDYC